MSKKTIRYCLTLVFLSALGSTLMAGGRLQQIDITSPSGPSPIPGTILAKVIGIQWDTRAIPVRYRVNNSLDPIPNPLGAASLSVADATGAFTRAMTSWNDIPTSFMRMEIAGTVNKTTLVGFDFVNELSFRTSTAFNAIASSPSVSLMQDTTLVDGDDLDGDGDSDVSGAITQVTDVDNDGDLEFPAGFYKAGTILDNDVQFNTKTSNGLRFTTTDAALDTVGRSVDLECVAVHELGHSHGLSHTLNNQKSAHDGNGATMFPFIDTSDPAAELAGRSLDSDDIGWVSSIYPEGSAATGVAAIQTGDIPFAAVYGFITGDVRHGLANLPIAGASVWATNRDTGEVVAAGFSGTTQLIFNPATGGLSVVNNPALHILDGRYQIPLPKGNYEVGVEPIDGNPAAAGSISFSAQIGSIFGLLNFNEEMFKKSKEGAFERRAGDASSINIEPGKTRSGIDITTNVTLNVNNFGSRNFVGFTGVGPGTLYAVRFPKAQIEGIRPGQDILVQSALFDTVLADASVPALFARAVLTTGKVDPATSAITTIDLLTPLDDVQGFLAADDDFGVLHFHDSKQLGQRIRKDMARGRIEDLFLVLQVPETTPFAGVSNLPPFIGLDGGVATNDVPIFGLSYVSLDGGATWTRRTDFNFRFSLVLAEPPPK